MLDIYPWEGAYIWKHEYTTFQPHAAEQRAPDAPWAAPIFVALSGFLSGGGSGCRRFHRKNGPGYRTGPSGCVFPPARRYLPAWTRPIAFHRPQPSAIYVGFYSQTLASLIVASGVPVALKGFFMGAGIFYLEQELGLQGLGWSIPLCVAPGLFLVMGVLLQVLSDLNERAGQPVEGLPQRAAGFVLVCILLESGAAPAALRAWLK